MYLALWVTKAVEYFKWGLKGHISRNMEESGSKSDLNCGGLAQEVLYKKNICMWLRDHSCDTLANNVANIVLVQKNSVWD